MLMEVEKFLRAKEMSATRFGRSAVRDPQLVHDMRRGRTVGQRLQGVIRAFMAAAR